MSFPPDRDRHKRLLETVLAAMEAYEEAAEKDKPHKRELLLKALREFTDYTKSRKPYVKSRSAS
jgi:hypothetical protein